MQARPRARRKPQPWKTLKKTCRGVSGEVERVELAVDNQEEEAAHTHIRTPAPAQQQPQQQRSTTNSSSSSTAQPADGSTTTAAAAATTEQRSQAQQQQQHDGGGGDDGGGVALRLKAQLG